MTLGALCALCAALAGFKIYPVCAGGKWIARGCTPGWVSPRWIGATGDSPMAAVENLLRRIGGTYES